MERKPFPERLRFRRIEKELSQSAAAEQLGVHPNTLAHWESGFRRPTHTKYKAVAEYLGEPLNDLMEELDDAP